MGKVSNLVDNLTFTSLQKTIFDHFSQDEILRKQFYFTGGTALSAIYLHHRESEDLDFFSETDFDNEITNNFVKDLSKVIGIRGQFSQIYGNRMYQFIQGKELVIKIDFNHYDYKRLEKGIKIDGVDVDSLKDIATNKLQTIMSRTQIKDFVDLYFLLKKFTLWDLIYGLEPKFKMEFDYFLLGSSFLKVQEFDVLPKMLIPLELKDLKAFYIDLTKKVGAKVTKNDL